MSGCLDTEAVAAAGVRSSTAHVHEPDPSGPTVFIMKISSIGIQRRTAVIAFLALLAFSVDIRAQTNTTMRPVLDRVEVDGLVVYVHYSLDNRAHTARLPVDLLLEMALEFPIEEEVLASNDSPMQTIRYADDSKINGHDYAIEIEKDGIATISDLSDGTVAQIPADIIRWAGAAYNSSFRTESLPVTSLIYNTETRAIGFFIRNSIPLAAAIILLVMMLSGSLFWLVYRARREKNATLVSRRHLVLARDSERKKMAADLHDGPIQGIQVLLRTDTGIRTRERRNGAVNREILHTVSDQLRDICAELRPPVLHHFGFPRAARARIAKFREHFPAIKLHSDIQDFSDQLSEELRTTLFRALQECLMNAGRHARAKNIWVNVALDDGQVCLSIRDDGIGFTSPKRLSELEATGHLGLSFLAQRVEATGAHLNISSVPGFGTTVVVEIPVKKVASKRQRGRAFARAT